MDTSTMANGLNASGGRLLMAAAAVLCVLSQGAQAQATDPPATLTVGEARGVYTVAARFVVDQPSSVAFAVLTDYEQIPRFMPGVRTSIVLERGPAEALVEQEAVSRMFVFTKRIHLVLEIDEQADAVLFHDRCGQSFARYEGAWRLTPHAGHTAIVYELKAEPTFDVPEFILKRLLRRDAGRMIEGLQREIAARATASSGARPARTK